VFIFASMSSDQICLASSEHLKKYRLQAASTFQRNLFIEKKRFSPSNLADILPFREELLHASVSIKRQQNEDPCFQKHS